MGRNNEFMKTEELGRAASLQEPPVMKQATLIRELVLSWREALEVRGSGVFLFLPASKYTKLVTARTRRSLECMPRTR